VFEWRCANRKTDNIARCFITIIKNCLPGRYQVYVFYDKNTIFLRCFFDLIDRSYIEVISKKYRSYIEEISKLYRRNELADINKRTLFYLEKLYIIRVIADKLYRLFYVVTEQFVKKC